MEFKENLSRISMSKNKMTASYDFSEIYKILIDKIIPDKTKNEINIPNVELITWGALYLETKINIRFELMISRLLLNIQPEEKVIIWDVIKYKNAKEKLELILKNSKTKQDSNDIISHKRFYGKLTEIRNRLTHYKEPAVEVPDKYIGSKIEELPFYETLKTNKQLSTYNIMKHMVKLAPDPKIKQDLDSISFDSYKKNIYAFGDWISNLY